TRPLPFLTPPSTRITLCLRHPFNLRRAVRCASFRLWCMDRTGDGIDADALGALSEVAAIDRIAIVEEMAWFLAPRRGLDELPPYPGCGRVGCHVDMHQFAPAVGDEHQHVQRLERQCGDAQQIGGPSVARMVPPHRATGVSGGGAGRR